MEVLMFSKNRRKRTCIGQVFIVKKWELGATIPKDTI
jgi:hypothetical protein